jgi:hypothetical protein
VRRTTKFKGGKYKGKTVEELMEFEAGLDYLEWMSTKSIDNDEWKERNLQDQKDLRAILASRSQVSADISGNLHIMQKLEQIIEMIEQLGAEKPTEVQTGDPLDEKDIKWDE